MGVLFCLGVVVRKQEETTISETKALPSYRVFAEARQEQGTLLNLVLEEKTVRRAYLRERFHFEDLCCV